MDYVLLFTLPFLEIKDVSSDPVASTVAFLLFESFLFFFFAVLEEQTLWDDSGAIYFVERCSLGNSCLGTLRDGGPTELS